MKDFFFGIDIGGTTIKMGLFDKNGSLVEKQEILTNKEDNGIHILSDIAESGLNLLASAGKDWNSVAGIGIGVPGPVIKNRFVTRCVNLGWEGIDVPSEIRQLTGIADVIAVNDAKAAALGEWWKGAHENSQCAVMLTLGTGIGGGVILDGRIINGAFGAAGEFSHFPLVPDETEPCACGKFGHLQQYASAEGLVSQFRKKLRIDSQKSMLSNKEKISAKDIFDAASSGDVPSMEAVDDAVKKIAQTMAMITTVIDPDLFLIGGGMAKAGDFLLSKIRKEFRRYALFVSETARIEAATLGNDAGMYGALKMIMDYVKKRQMNGSAVGLLAI